MMTWWAIGMVLVAACVATRTFAESLQPRTLPAWLHVTLIWLICLKIAFLWPLLVYWVIKGFVDAWRKS